MASSVTYILGVQGPRLVHIARPLDNGAAVGEHGELVAFRGKLEQETVVAHLAESRQVPGHLFEIELGRRPLRHLHRITAAQTGGLRALFAFEPLETPPLTARTIDLAQKGRD